MIVLGIGLGSVAAQDVLTPDTAWRLTVEPGVNELHLDWEPPNSTVDSTVAGYKVYRGPSPDSLEPVETVSETSYDDSDLANGTTYYYQVNTTYADASEGEGTDVENGTTYAPPTAPTNATAQAGPAPGNITVTWDPPLDDGRTNVTSYTVVAYNQTGNETQNWTRQPGNRTVVAGNLSSDTFRSYRVAAVNAVGAGNTTEPLNATTWRIPEAPQNVAVEAGPGPRQMNVTFDPPTATGGPNLTEYVVHRSTDDTNLTEHAAVDTNQTGFVDEDVPPGTEIRYAVAAANPVGLGPESEVASATSHSLPAAPSADAETGPGVSNVTVTWSSVDGGAFDVTAYVVEHRHDASADWARIAVLGPGNTSYIHQGLPEGTLHDYRVSAVTPVGQGPASNAASASTIDLAEPPANVTARPGSEAGQIVVEWEAAKETGDGALTGYRVEIRDGATWNEVEVGPDATSHTVDGIDAGAKRDLRVRALTGAGPGEASETVSATTHDRPNPPTDVEADLSRDGDRVAVTWNAPSVSGLDLIEYQVKRRTADGTWEQIATVDADGTRYVDEDLPEAAGLDYAVHAVNAVGPSLSSEADSVSLPTQTVVDQDEDTNATDDEDVTNASSTSPPPSSGSRAASAQGGLLPFSGGLLGLALLGAALLAGAVVLADHDDEAPTSHAGTTATATAQATTAASTPTRVAALPGPDDVDPPGTVPPGQLRTRLEAIEIPRHLGPLTDVAETLTSRRRALLDGLTRGEPVQEIDVARLETDVDRFAHAVDDLDAADARLDDVADRLAREAGRLGPTVAEAVRDAKTRRRPDEVAVLEEAIDAVAGYHAWSRRVADLQPALTQAAADVEDDVAADLDELRAFRQATLTRLLVRGPTGALAEVARIRVTARRDAVTRLQDLHAADAGDYVAELEAATGDASRSIAAEVAGLGRWLKTGDAGLADVDRPGLLGQAQASEGARHLAVTLPRLLGLPDRHVGDAVMLDRVAEIALRGDGDAEDALATYVAGKAGETDPVLEEVVAVLAEATPTTATEGSFDDAVLDAVRRDLDRFDVVAYDALRDRVLGDDADDAIRGALEKLDDVAYDAEAGLVGRRRAGRLDADQLHALRRRLDVDPDTLETFLAEITFDGETDHDD